MADAATGVASVAAVLFVAALSVAAFKAGAAHPRRQKHREMPPPGASAPAFAATVEPTFTQITFDLPPAHLQSDSSNERVLRNGLHPASILDFRARLANRCKVFPVYGHLRASILDFRPELGNRCKDFPVNTLFRASILDFRARLGNRCKDFPVYPLVRASILDFKPKLANRCKLFPVYTLFRASILDFRPELGNRCKVFPVYGHSRASILDFRGSIWESLQVFPRLRPFACSDS